MRSLWQDVKYGARLLSKNRRFTVVAVFTLGLGIGANAAIFSVINGVLLRPFSFPDSERLVVVWERCVNQGLPRMVVSPPNFADLREQNQAFRDMAAYRQQDFNLIGDGDPERVRASGCLQRCFRCSESGRCWVVIFNRTRISLAPLPQSS